MPTEEKKIDAPEQTAEDPTAPFQYGIDQYVLILYTNKNKGPFTINAYVKSRGMVEITNIRTMGNELKMVIGVNKLMLPENEPIYITADIKKLLNLDDKVVTKRKDLADVKKFDPDATGVHVVKVQGDTGDAAKKIVGGM